MKRVLFVDDEVAVLDGLRDRLRKQRHEWDMVFALGGAQALAECERGAFDIVITDMRMPGVDGAAVLRHVKETHPSTIRIVLSGHAEREAVMRAIPVAHQFLGKPCEAETLRDVISRACTIQALMSDGALKELIGRVERLPCVSTTYTALIEVLAGKAPSIDDVVAVIELDPAMCLKLLQLVNSAFFGLPRRVSAMRDAITYLGIDLVKTLVLTTQIFAAAQGDQGLDAAALSTLQRHSVLTARVAHAIAPSQQSDAFMAGMLHDVGRIILALADWRTFVEISAAASERAVPLHVVERERLGVTHAEIGAYILGSWGLPLTIVEAVAGHHEPQRLQGSSFDVMTAVHIAEGLANESEGDEMPGADGGLDRFVSREARPDREDSCLAGARESNADGGASVRWPPDRVPPRGLDDRRAAPMRKRRRIRHVRPRSRPRAETAESDARVVRGQLEALLEHAPAYILAVDRSGSLQFINRVLPNFKREDVIGSYWLDHVDPSLHESMKARLREVLETGAPQNYETSAVSPDGSKTVFAAHMGAMRIDGRIVGAVIIAQDVTELKLAQAELLTSQRLAALGVLTAGVAHEINTPIQFVNDSVQFLREATDEVFGVLDSLGAVERLAAAGEPAPAMTSALAAAAEAQEEADLPYLRESVPRAFDRCFEGLGRVVAIVRSLQQFAAPIRREMAPVDLNRALETTLAIARGSYDHVATLETEFGDLPPVTCLIDDINKVVRDLVENAAQAIEEALNGGNHKGTITVRTRRDRESVVIAVSDTGTGIPQAIGQRVFEPFFTTREVGRGTGQGLALAWAVVKRTHGGDLRFETEIGRGTTFFVRLPIAGTAAR